MIRNTLFAEAFVNAAAKAIQTSGSMKAAPWTARRVAERVTNTRTGTIREDDVHVRASYRTRQHIAKVCGVTV